MISRGRASASEAVVGVGRALSRPPPGYQTEDASSAAPHPHLAERGLQPLARGAGEAGGETSAVEPIATTEFEEAAEAAAVRRARSMSVTRNRRTARDRSQSTSFLLSRRA